MSSSSISQDEILSAPRSANIRYFKLKDVEDMEQTLRHLSPDTIGMAIKLAPTGLVSAVALATDSQIFHLSWEKNELHLLSKKAISKALQSLFSPSDDDTTFAAFEMAHVAPLLQGCFTCCDIRGVDLSTIVTEARNGERFKSPGIVISSLEGQPGLQRRIDMRWDTSEESEGDEPNVCLRAWFSAIACRAIVARRGSLAHIPKLDTSNLTRKVLATLGDLAKRVQLLNAMKPLVQENNFCGFKLTKDGDALVTNLRFKTRVRKSEQTSVELVTAGGAVYSGRATRTQGKQTTVRITKAIQGDVKRIRVHGREELTNAENAQYQFISFVLRGRVKLNQSSNFIKLVWFSIVSHPNLKGGVGIGRSMPSTALQTLDKLNDSQREVVEVMLSGEGGKSLVIVHGPPGTGKTSTIASAVKCWSEVKEPVWVVAQSNVGVKNIAESLARKNIDFKLVVSKEFYVEWHEDIYDDVQDRIIRSDDLPTDDRKGVATERLFGDTTVVLCTLSMLSNPIMDLCRLFILIPVRRLVIDEASQIDVFEFIHLFDKFRRDLLKVCFFGDPKQLPPYGSEQAKLETIFEIKHLRKTAYFLNTQYRMPVPLGGFISTKVYDNKLRSKHSIQDLNCVRFVNVSKGWENKSGTSYINMEEVHTVVRLVKYYYRYKDFCIITPYDPQRAAITKQLEIEKLPFNCVFNVDSFQGNEADYVIVSTVRTEGPGFLKSKKRVNVMLTRCKKGMVIVANRGFFRRGGRDTLLGMLASYWEDTEGEGCWIDWKLVAEGKANMPGVYAIPRPVGAPVVLPSPPPSSSESAMPSPHANRLISGLNSTSSITTVRKSPNRVPITAGTSARVPQLRRTTQSQTVPPPDFPTLSEPGRAKPAKALRGKKKSRAAPAKSLKT
ncbi:hypothetical protein EW146_g6849 [Bondarzewia mesenterica]|uniref:DNA2/NAM7 helicase-like C-terminal domain-containing protein n=1 Tax=Bondarzewia mesenterica TaxID=1095465 RepID=A0A4S4LMD8_9AGAM|nr:hypothetical protein EW146_g6849 [Bondarzewia mesenterica]